jgi:hypothetical protein
MIVEHYKNMSLKDIRNEIWVTVNGYPMYEVSNMGRVCAKERVEQTSGFWDRSNHSRKIKRRMFKQTLQGGYLHVSFYKGDCGPKDTFVVHRLVGLHFIPNPENKPEVNHKKGIKTDNRASQLEWNTHGENIRHAHATGLKKNLSGESHPRTSLKHIDVINIRKLYSTGTTLKELSKKYKTKYCTIWALVKGKSFKYVKR